MNQSQLTSAKTDRTLDVLIRVGSFFVLLNSARILSDEFGHLQTVRVTCDVLAILGAIVVLIAFVKKH